MLMPYLKNHPDAIYLYAGGVIDGEYQQNIVDYAARHGISEQIRYAGELCPGQMLNQYYNAAAATVFPSKIESFGLVIIESLCAGTPVLLSGKPLFSLQGGYHVYHSDEEFLQRVDQMLREECERTDVRKEAAERYGWQRAAADHMHIWQRRNTNV